MSRRVTRRLAIPVASSLPRVLLWFFAALGFVQMCASLLSWPGFADRRLLVYLAAAAVADLIPLKRASRSLSLSVPFVLLSIVDLSMPEAVVVGCASVLIQFLRQSGIRGQVWRIAIGVAVQATVISTAKFAMESLLPQVLSSIGMRVAVATVALFVSNTLPAAMVMRLTENRRVSRIWRESFFRLFSLYAVSGVVALAAHRASAGISTQDVLLALTVVFLAHRSYLHHREKVEFERKHAREIAEQHFRAIEGLALAAEARDNLTTRGHIRRVQVYSLAIGREMGLDARELESLRAGALLHDIGKLAVPDHILTKPGKLTPEEFARLKVHPLVGAEIVERMGFPYAVAPIVREHHEKWNGAGYPFGLTGEAISPGARILAVVDCLDALTSDREYRKAMRFEEAVEYISSESGQSYDPSVVDVLRRLGTSLTSLDRGEQSGVSFGLAIENGKAPAAGLDLCDVPNGPAGAPNFLASLLAVTREGNALRKLAASASALELEELLPRLLRNVERIVPYDAAALFLPEANVLRVEFATGIYSGQFASLEVPTGQGLTGWVAQHRQAILNGTPALDPGFPEGAGAALQSSLALPVEAGTELLGVMVLYRKSANAFSAGELRMLRSALANVAEALQNGFRYRQTRRQASLDPATGLPGLEAFLKAAGEEISRAGRRKDSLCLLVMKAGGSPRLGQGLSRVRRDEIAAVLAGVMKGACRDYDRLGCIGPECLAVVLPGMRANRLARLLDRMRALISKAGLEEPLSPDFGGAFYPDDGDGAWPLLTVALKRAENAESRWADNIRALADAVYQPAGNPAETLPETSAPRNR